MDRSAGQFCLFPRLVTDKDAKSLSCMFYSVKWLPVSSSPLKMRGKPVNIFDVIQSWNPSGGSEEEMPEWRACHCWVDGVRPGLCFFWVLFLMTNIPPDINTGREGNNNILSPNKQNRNGWWVLLQWGSLRGLHCGISCFEQDGFSILIPEWNFHLKAEQVASGTQWGPLESSHQWYSRTWIQRHRDLCFSQVWVRAQAPLWCQKTLIF